MPSETSVQSILDPLLRLAAMLALMHAVLLAPIDPEFAAWSPSHGHVEVAHGVAPDHTHPWDADHEPAADGEAEVVFLAAGDGVAAAARPAIAGDVFRLASLAVVERALALPAVEVPRSAAFELDDPPPRGTASA